MLVHQRMMWGDVRDLYQKCFSKQKRVKNEKISGLIISFV